MRKPKINFDLGDQDLQKLPHSEGLERCVLGSILWKPELFKEAAKYINAKGMFYDPLNENVWSKMLYLSDKGISPSPENLKVEYEKERNKELEIYVQQLPKESASDIYLKKHCLILNEFWIRRTICRLGHHLNRKALGLENDPLELLSLAQEAAGKVLLHIAKMKEKTLEDSAMELATDIYEITNSSNGLLGLPSILNGLNRVIKGYRKGNAIVIAASTGEGKTTFALNEVQDWVESGIPVGYVSLEMKTKELMLMMASRRTGIAIDKILGRECTQDEIQEISLYVNQIKQMPLYVSETGGMTIGEIKAQARAWKEKHGIQALVIDHIHLVNADDPSLQSEAKFTVVANELKALAKELDIPVLELAQFARPEKGTKRPHEITDLKYASGIEQAADVIIMIYRPEKHGITEFPDGSSNAGYSRFLIGKLRLLKAEHVSAHFSGVEFKDWDEWKNSSSSTPTPPLFPPHKIFQNRQPFTDRDDAPF